MPIAPKNISVINPEPQKGGVRKFLKKYFALILILLVIALALTSVYFYRKSSGASQEAEVKSLVQKVGKIALLPTDEMPTIATVSDPEKLKNQAFFIDAKVGYKVLVYANAKKAILYDPESNKIVNIAPVNAEGAATQ